MVSATLSGKVEALGNRLMEEYVKVGFDVDQGEGFTLKDSIPGHIKQRYVEVPTQYRLLYLLAFLFANQESKVIVFASNCEIVNFIYDLLSTLDWQSVSDKPALQNANKLHGEMDHGERKKHFAQFDKAEAGVLVCTDVASRGLDFKHVQWVIQYDLTSLPKDYANRVGRTARISEAGQSLCFVMPQEIGYIKHMQKDHQLEIQETKRWAFLQNFQQTASRGFRHLTNIDSEDEKWEALHALRQIVRDAMKSEALTKQAEVAKRSSIRAYAGH